MMSAQISASADGVRPYTVTVLNCVTVFQLLLSGCVRLHPKPFWKVPAPVQRFRPFFTEFEVERYKGRASLVSPSHFPRGTHRHTVLNYEGGLYFVLSSLPSWGFFAVLLQWSHEASAGRAARVQVCPNVRSRLLSTIALPTFLIWRPTWIQDTPTQT